MAQAEQESPPRQAVQGQAKRSPSPNTREHQASRSTGKRWLVRLAVLIVLAGGLAAGAWYLVGLHKEGNSHLTLFGNVDVRQVNLAFRVGGRVESLAVDEGDAVTKGQLLARLEENIFQDDLHLAQARRDVAAANLERLENGSRPEEIAEARAQLARWQATLDRAREDFQRAKRTVGTGAIAPEEFDRLGAVLAEARAQVNLGEASLRLVEAGPRYEDIKAARASLRAEQARLAESERRLTDSRLFAPNDGIIFTRAREPGAIVSSGDTTFTLTLSSPVWVRTYVDEPNLGYVRPGMVARIRTDASPGQVYQGKVGFISPKAEFTPKAVETPELRTRLVYRVRIVVDNPDQGLRQGMPVTVTLDLPQPQPRTFWEKLRDAMPWSGNDRGD
jgi:HlyD family secretion protein